MKFLNKLISWFRPKKIMTGSMGTRMDERIEKNKFQVIPIGDTITYGTFENPFMVHIDMNDWKESVYSEPHGLTNTSEESRKTAREHLTQSFSKFAEPLEDE